MHMRQRRMLRPVQVPSSHRRCHGSAGSSCSGLHSLPLRQSSGNTGSSRRQQLVVCAAKKRRKAEAPVEPPPEEDEYVDVEVRVSGLQRAISISTALDIETDHRDITVDAFAGGGVW